MDTVLFDLDGTLLPMDLPRFMKIYMGALAQTCAGHGFDGAASVDAVWEGTRAMVQNDGAATNEERFWQTFARIMGPRVLELKPVLELFYENEFCAAQQGTMPNPPAAALVKDLREKGYTVVLATNPLFPHTAVRTRLGWIGLAPEDFDHLTSYEHCHYCKPNPAYYTEILNAIGKAPQDCLMVGNDVEEDSVAHTLGMSFFLVTDNLLNPNGRDIGAWHSGDFAACRAHIQSLA